MNTRNIMATLSVLASLHGWVGVSGIAYPAKTYQEVPVWEPDTWVRERTRYVRPEDVSCLVFGGEELVGNQPNGYIEVNDPELIARFVLALRTAVQPTLPPSAPGEPPNVRYTGAFSWETSPRIDVYLKPNAQALANIPVADRKRGEALGNRSIDFGRTKRGEYLRFYFHLETPDGCLGPRFWSALHALNKYQAASIRRTVAQYKTEVVAFRFSLFSDEMDKQERISDPAKVAAFVDALGQVDERAYQWQFRPGTKSTQGLATMTELELRDGRRVPLVLMPKQPDPHPERDSLWLQTLYKSLQGLTP